MKKILLTLVVAAASLAANAQVWVGGSLGYNHTKFNDLKVNTFEVKPEVGYTLSDKWDIALGVGFESIKVTGLDAVTNFAVAPYARYTFYQTGKVGFILDAGFSVKTGDFYVEDLDDYVNDDTQWGIGIRPGIKFAASDKVTLIATLGGLGYMTMSDVDYDKFGFNVNGNNLTFGFYYSF